MSRTHHAVAIALLASTLLFVHGCAREALPTAPSATHTSTRLSAAWQRAIDVHARNADRLLAMPGVSAVGVAPGVSGRPALAVYLEAPLPTEFPPEIEDVPLVTEVLGTFVPFALTDRVRPVSIGVSIGNENECLPGTVGCVLERGGRRYLLSASHVFARRNVASPGEAIVQPSRADASATCAPSPLEDRVAELVDFEPIRFGGESNIMDAAIAAIGHADVVCSTPAGFYGSPGATPVTAVLGMAIQKLGRTTGLTASVVKAVNVKVKVSFPEGKATYVGQVLTGRDFGAFGDSGSLVVTRDGLRSPLGLVFAGTNNGTALVCPMQPVLDRFGATICSE